MSKRVSSDDQQLEVTLASLPKVELHVYLEGATDAETIWEMAQRNGCSLPGGSLDGWRDCYSSKTSITSLMSTGRRQM